MTTKSCAIKKIAVLCSGGDAPGMNAAVRAVVRTAIGKGPSAYGIQKGYSGLLEGNIFEMDLASVGNIIQRGGTILQSSRCPEFLKKEIRKEAAHILKRKKIDALVVIGGNGSFNGAYHLSVENDLPVVAIPGTIDNDIKGTHYSIGFDTAVQTAMEAVDKIRDTAWSHDRTFLIEVMGRQSPAIAIHVGVTTGAENIITPNQKVDYDQIAHDILRGIKRHKNSSIIIVAEGKEPGLGYRIQQQLEKKHQISARLCVLGHIQRGGRPSTLDRFLASKMGHDAVNCLLEGKKRSVTAFLNGRIQIVDLDDCLEKNDQYDLPYLALAKALSI